MVWLWFGACVVCSLVGAYVANEKDRVPLEGALFGVLLGPLGVLIAVLMPAGSPAVERPYLAGRVDQMHQAVKAEKRL